MSEVWCCMRTLTRVSDVSWLCIVCIRLVYTHPTQQDAFTTSGASCSVWSHQRQPRFVMGEIKGVESVDWAVLLYTLAPRAVQGQCVVYTVFSKGLKEWGGGNVGMHCALEMRCLFM